MKPGRLPDNQLWPGARRVQFVAPDDMPDQAMIEILPVDTIVDEATTGIARFQIKIDLEPGDVEKMQKLGWFWLVFYGGVQPFDVGFPEIEDWFEIEDES